MNNTTKRVTHEEQPGMERRSFHAFYHRKSVEQEFATRPPDGPMPIVITASTDDGFTTHELEMPGDEAKKVALCHALAAQLRGEGARTAAISYTTVANADGPERICVLAVDNKGGEDAWHASVIRSKAHPPTLADWRHAKPGGIFGLMLHAAVTVDG